MLTERNIVQTEQQMLPSIEIYPKQRILISVKHQQGKGSSAFAELFNIVKFTEATHARYEVCSGYVKTSNSSGRKCNVNFGKMFAYCTFFLY